MEYPKQKHETKFSIRVFLLLTTSLWGINTVAPVDLYIAVSCLIYLFDVLKKYHCKCPFSKFLQSIDELGFTSNISKNEKYYSIFISNSL